MKTARRLQLYPMLKTAVMLILGIILGKAVFPYFPLWFFLAATAGMVAVAFLLHRSPAGQSLAINLAFLCLGATLITHSLISNRVELPDREVEYKAVIASEPVVHGKVLQADILIVGGKGKPSDARPWKVKASILRDTVENRWKRLHVGDGIIAVSYLEHPHNFANSTFDYASWLRNNGFVAETFIYYSNWKKAEVELQSLSTVEWMKIVMKRFRQRLLAYYSSFGADRETYAVIAAMTLGDKSALPKELKDDYSVAGASHVLALSGLHLGIIYTILSLLTLGYRRQWLSQLLIMVVVWGYVLMVGMPSSVVRSAVMLTVLAMVTILNRGSVLLNSLSFAAIVMLIANPLSLYDIGFQMSFLAVTGIALFEPLMMPLRRKKGIVATALRWLWGTVSVSIAAQLTTAPLVAYYFGRFSCYFIVTNLIVIPCATFVIYGVVATAAVMWWPAAAHLSATAVMTVTSLMNNALHWIASLPGASVEGISWSPMQVIAVYIMVIALYFAMRYMRKSWDIRHRISW